MSTAIALQNISTPTHESSTLRQRHGSKDIPIKSMSPEHHDPWLNSPHDNEGVSITVDSQDLNPTKIFWVSPHGLLTKNITILDLTQDMDVPYTGLTETYKAQVQKTLKDHSFTPVLTCHRTSWLGLEHHITDAHCNPVAHWLHPWHSAGEALLTFPADSRHSSHPINLRNKRWGMRTEAFTVDSQPYVWQADSFWHAASMTLYRVSRSAGDKVEKKVEVAKFAQKHWGPIVTGGTLVVDEKGIDEVVACLTLVVALKKKRQRAAQRGSGGGAIGGM